MSVVAVEYPGYGLSGEEFSTDLFFKTAEAAVEYFRTGCYANTPLILFGRSLGCLLCTFIAAKMPDVSGVVLESPACFFSHFSCLYSLLSKKARSRLGRLDCATYLPKVDCPLMVLYGSRDAYSSPSFHSVEMRACVHV